MFLKSNKIVFDLNSDDIEIGNLRNQYERLITKFILEERYEEAARLRDEAIRKGVIPS